MSEAFIDQPGDATIRKKLAPFASIWSA